MRSQRVAHFSHMAAHMVVQRGHQEQENEVIDLCASDSEAEGQGAAAPPSHHFITLSVASVVTSIPALSLAPRALAQAETKVVEEEEEVPASVHALYDPRFFSATQPFRDIPPALQRQECSLTLTDFSTHCEPSLAALAATFRDPVTHEFVQTCPVHARLRGGGLSRAVYEEATLRAWTTAKTNMEHERVPQ